MKRVGPIVTIKMRCTDCVHEVSERYQVQGDSGCDVYCVASGTRRLVGDTSWDTPDWCPFREAAMKEQVK